jgi:lysozyme
MKEIILALVALTSPIDSAVCKPCAISHAGVSLIKNFEGYSPYIYKDVAGYDTIGFGHLVRKGEKIQQPLLGKAADDLLRKDLQQAEQSVNKSVQIRLAQYQYDPLVSFTFNLGGGAFGKSTLLKKVNTSQHKTAALEFLKWNKAGGKVSKGLIRRRYAEAFMYAKNDSSLFQD